MKQLIALAVVALAWQIVSASAGEEAVVSSKEVAAPPPPPTSYFRSNEFSLGVFGSYGVAFYDNHRAIGEHAWGGGNPAPTRQVQPSKPRIHRAARAIRSGMLPLFKHQVRRSAPISLTFQRATDFWCLCVDTMRLSPQRFRNRVSSST
jgi:hypothetical protein